MKRIFGDALQDQGGEVGDALENGVGLCKTKEPLRSVKPSPLTPLGKLARKEIAAKNQTCTSARVGRRAMHMTVRTN